LSFEGIKAHCHLHRRREKENRYEREGDRERFPLFIWEFSRDLKGQSSWREKTEANEILEEEKKETTKKKRM